MGQGEVSRSKREVLKRIDYGGSLTLLGAVCGPPILSKPLSSRRLIGSIVTRLPEYAF